MRILTRSHIWYRSRIQLRSCENSKNDDFKNVLNCGTTIDKILEERGRFLPEFYIIVDHTGDHYKLIGYKKKLIFKFIELPYDLKKMIHDKCLEKNSGLFSLIPDFQKFKAGVSKSLIKEAHYEDLTESKLRGLYDDDVVFQFYAKSSSKSSKLSSSNTASFLTFLSKYLYIRLISNLLIL